MQSVTFAGRCQLQQKIGSNIDQPFIKLARAPDHRPLSTSGEMLRGCVLGGQHRHAVGSEPHPCRGRGSRGPAGEGTAPPV